MSHCSKEKTQLRTKSCRVRRNESRTIQVHLFFSTTEGITRNNERTLAPSLLCCHVVNGAYADQARSDCPHTRSALGGKNHEVT